MAVAWARRPFGSMTTQDAGGLRGGCRKPTMRIPHAAHVRGPFTSASAAECKGPRCAAGDWRIRYGDCDVRERQQALRRFPGRQGPQSRDRRRRVHGPGGTVRLRQDDQPANDRRPRGDQQRNPADRRPGRQRCPAQGPRHRDGLPELRALPAYVGPREPGLRVEAAQGPQGRDRAPGQRDRRDDPARQAARSKAEGVVRRPAPARRPWARDRSRTGGLPDGRTAVHPRRQAPRPDTRRDCPPTSAAQDDDRIRDPRPMA